MTSETAPPPPGAPLQPHEFVPKEEPDPGLAAFASGAAGSVGVTGAAAPAAMTGQYIRESLCDVPGCNRPEADPIHQAPEE